MAGNACRPTCCAARQRRSPATISKSPAWTGCGRRISGWITPFSRIDAARSCKLLLVEVPPRLVRVRPDAVDRNRIRCRRPRCRLGGSAGRLVDRGHVRQQRRQAAAETLAFHCHPPQPPRPLPRDAHAGQHLAGQPLVGHAARARPVVDQRRDRMRRRLAQAHVARDDRVVDQRAQVRPSRPQRPARTSYCACRTWSTQYLVSSGQGWSRPGPSGPCASVGTGPPARRTRIAAAPAPNAPRPAR